MLLWTGSTINLENLEISPRAVGEKETMDPIIKNCSKHSQFNSNECCCRMLF